MVAQKSYPAGLRMPRHEHRRAYFSLVSHGSYCERVDGKERTVEAPNILFHPAGEEHDVKFGPVGSSIVGLEIDFGTLDKASICGAVVSRPTELNTPATHWIAARVKEELRRADNLSAIALEALTMELLVEMGREQVAPDEKRPVALAKEFIHEHLGEELALGAIAAAAGLHPSALSRSFRRETGETVGGYIRHQRIRAATEKLLRTELTLSDISSHLGFADPSHFARTFRQITGLAPREFRKTHRRG